MLFDNGAPRYLPHIHTPEVLNMGLPTLGQAAWIETDTSVGEYHAHKLQQRTTRGDDVYRATEGSLPALARYRP